MDRFYAEKRANYGVFNGTKNADNGAKYRLDSFSGRRRRGYLKFPSLGGPHAGEKRQKNTHWEDPKRGGNRGPGRPGLRMAAKLFEIEMQITCTNVQKTKSYVCKLLSPCHGPKKTCGVGGHPTRSGVNMGELMINNQGLGIPYVHYIMINGPIVLPLW